mmetsp:Transcript_2795/g.8786  ORF Transcript_2795/g.8786 Transcript_2795/m.8786 type:complete len:209 (+) Transcript_2795:4072-4698(+)
MPQIRQAPALLSSGLTPAPNLGNFAPAILFVVICMIALVARPRSRSSVSLAASCRRSTTSTQMSCSLNMFAIETSIKNRKARGAASPEAGSSMASMRSAGVAEASDSPTVPTRNVALAISDKTDTNSRNAIGASIVVNLGILKTASRRHSELAHVASSSCNTERCSEANRKTVTMIICHAESRSSCASSSMHKSAVEARIERQVHCEA